MGAMGKCPGDSFLRRLWAVFQFLSEINFFPFKYGLKLHGGNFKMATDPSATPTKKVELNFKMAVNRDTSASWRQISILNCFCFLNIKVFNCFFLPNIDFLLFFSQKSIFVCQKSMIYYFFLSNIDFLLFFCQKSMFYCFQLLIFYCSQTTIRNNR